MARTFHRRRTLDALTEINVTPLIDLAFALLIIFMITAPLLEQSIELELPVETASPQSPPPERPTVALSLDAQGQLYWDSEAIAMVDLPDRLSEAASGEPIPIIRVRADANLPYQRVVTVIDAVKSAGLVDLSLDTRVQ